METPETKYLSRFDYAARITPNHNMLISDDLFHFLMLKFILGFPKDGSDIIFRMADFLAYLGTTYSDLGVLETLTRRLHWGINKGVLLGGGDLQISEMDAIECTEHFLDSGYFEIPSFNSTSISAYLTSVEALIESTSTAEVSIGVAKVQPLNRLAKRFKNWLDQNYDENLTNSQLFEEFLFEVTRQSYQIISETTMDTIWWRLLANSACMKRHKEVDCSLSLGNDWYDSFYIPDIVNVQPATSKEVESMLYI